jgi:molybdopterin synthase sulfur carrier subunit
MNRSVTIRLYAAARAAADQSEILVDPNRLDRILDAIAINKPGLAQVFTQCSFLVDGVVVHDREVQISAHSLVDVLPPFAGG